MRFTYTGKRFSCQLQCTQCTATTKSGQRCKRRVCVGQPKCSQHRDFVIKKSGIPNAGMGLFAKREFKKNEVIGEYYGEQVNASQLKSRYGQSTAPYALQAGGVIFDAACKRSLMSVANARKNFSQANAKFSNSLNANGRVNVRAKKKIKAGKEVFVHYGSDYWKFNDGTYKTK